MEENKIVTLRQPGEVACLAIVTGVRGPEGVGLEMCDRISRNFVDDGPDSRFVPDVLDKRTMASGSNLGPGALVYGRDGAIDRSVVKASAN